VKGFWGTVNYRSQNKKKDPRHKKKKPNKKEKNQNRERSTKTKQKRKKKKKPQPPLVCSQGKKEGNCVGIKWKSRATPGNIAHLGGRRCEEESTRSGQTPEGRSERQANEVNEGFVGEHSGGGNRKRGGNWVFGRSGHVEGGYMATYRITSMEGFKGLGADECLGLQQFYVKNFRKNNTWERYIW